MYDSGVHGSHPVALCDGDEFIVDTLRIRGECSARDMQRLNACVCTCVSRLSKPYQGTKIQADVLAGKGREHSLF
jgi:hypothetical protein